MWGSEFTSKGATLQGGPAETAAGLNVELWVLAERGGGGSGELQAGWVIKLTTDA